MPSGAPVPFALFTPFGKFLSLRADDLHHRRQRRRSTELREQSFSAYGLVKYNISGRNFPVVISAEMLTQPIRANLNELSTAGEVKGF